MTRVKQRRLTAGNATIVLLVILSFVGDFLLAKWVVESQIGDEKLLGDASKKVYHYVRCMFAQDIREEDKVWFSSPQEAKENGYTPCTFCKPR